MSRRGALASLGVAGPLFLTNSLLSKVYSLFSIAISTNRPSISIINPGGMVWRWCGFMVQIYVFYTLRQMSHLSFSQNQCFD
jgi:hypothetical protein